MPDLSFADTTEDPDTIPKAQRADRTDPAPNTKARRSRSTGKPPGRPVGTTNQARFAKELSEELNIAMKMVALAWSPRDPFCAGVLDQQSEAIATSLADLLSESETARKYLSKGLGLGKVLPLIMATMPLVSAVRYHHLTPDDMKDAMANQQEAQMSQQAPSMNGWLPSPDFPPFQQA